MTNAGAHVSRACKTPRMSELPPPIADPSPRLRSSWIALEALRTRVVAGDPWPLAEAFGTQPEASWGPREVLAHTAEMLPFWLGEYERVVEAGRRPGDPPAFGRTADDPLRIAILERDRTLPLRELFDRIRAGIERWERRLGEVEPGEGAAVGRHSKLGDMTADQLRDRFVVTHLEEHARQLEELLRER
jgi:hypothetical protein